MKTQFKQNGIRYNIQLTARSFNEPERAILADPTLWTSAQKRKAGMQFDGTRWKNAHGEGQNVANDKG